MGSSPHTRGALGLFFRVAIGDRIIPAYAGSTLWIANVVCEGRDHPRIRGEHKGAFSVLALIRGSSPHTRGARDGG